jgi:predicted transposase YbfD/YdcC
VHSPWTANLSATPSAYSPLPTTRLEFPKPWPTAQKKGDGENCELKAAQKLIKELPSLNGKTVTADPLHNQQETARIIVEKGGDYLLQVKGNQPSLFGHIQAAFSGTKPRYGSAEKKHGRIEQRAIVVLPTNAMECSFSFARSIIAIWNKVERNGKETETTRYYITSHAPHERTEVQWHKLIRGHWGGVENRNHWSKDAIWREDATRSRNPNLVGNLALLRNALLALVEKERETYDTLPAFTEAMQADHALPFSLITRNLHY